MSALLDKVLAVHKKTSFEYTIMWYDDKTLVYPVPEKILPDLTIREKSLACNAKTQWKQEIVYDYLNMYEIIEWSGEKILVTYQGFCHRILPKLITAGKTVNFLDCRESNSKLGQYPKPALDLMYGFRFSQKELISEGLRKEMSGLVGAPTRYGKCLHLNELCIKYDYTTVRAVDVKDGDLLMGPDGLPRKVTGCIRGVDPSYRIIPNKGFPFICNEDHILSLKVTGGAKLKGYEKGTVINISVKDYLAKPKSFKHATRLYYAPLEFPEKELPFDPWTVGAWFGHDCLDGTGKITQPNESVIISKQLEEVDINADNHFRHIAQFCTKANYKYIPIEYLTASRIQRLELLAGLIDTAGHSNNGLGYEITTKYEELAHCIVRLCRGLGFCVTCRPKVKTIKSLGFSGTHYRLRISGPLHDVPCRGNKKVHSVNERVDPTTTGFKVEYVGEQEYAGFELEGPDKLFLLWDHLVTHNTTLMVNTLRAFPTLNTVVTAPGVDLVKQLYADITGPRGIPKGSREVRLICSGKGRTPATTPGGITICSADSLDKCDYQNTELLLADEPHSLVTTTRLDKINAFTRARRIGYGATLKGRFDGRDALIEGVFGPVLANRTYKEAVAEGAICPLAIIFLKVEIPKKNYRDRNTAYSSLLFHNPNIMSLAKRICFEVIPEEWQTLIFIKDENQAEMLLEEMNDEATIAMAKRMTSKEREEVDRLMKENVIKRCLCTKIYVQGVTFSDVRVLLNLEAGGNNTSAIQKPGRLAEIRPGKKCGIVLDLMFTPPSGASSVEIRSSAWNALCIDSMNRRKAYEECGYDVYTVNNLRELKDTFDRIR